MKIIYKLTCIGFFSQVQTWCNSWSLHGQDVTKTERFEHVQQATDRLVQCVPAVHNQTSELDRVVVFLKENKNLKSIFETARFLGGIGLSLPHIETCVPNERSD
jgi:hypothetical protein